MIGFQAIIPQAGFAGWSFFQRTQEVQRAVFEKSPEMVRDLEYFKEHISEVTTAEGLVNDRRLLKVALGAFGLDEDLNKRAYILKVLAEGTDDEGSFANKLVDKRYHKMAEAFGYGNQLGARVSHSDFAEAITSQYKTRQFEVAVGDADQSIRLAMGFLREISDYAGQDSSENSMWYKIMGNPPMKNIFETAFGLPKEFGGLDIEKQRDILKEKTGRMFGESSPVLFENRENVDKLLRVFFVRKQLSENSGAGSSGTIALTLLRNSTAAMSNFFQSRI